jgi:hypothetical protein
MSSACLKWTKEGGAVNQPARGLGERR